MNVKQTVIVLSIFLLLLGLVLFVEQPFKQSSTRSIDEIHKLFPYLDSEKVAGIKITQAPGQSFELKKTDSGWVVSSLDNVPANSKEIEDMLKSASEFDNADIRSTNPENQQLFQVDAQGIEVELSDNAEKVMAHFFVGKNGPSYTNTYVRVADSSEVTLQKGYLKTTFDKSRYKWRDRDILALDAETISGISLHSMIEQEQGKKKVKVPQDISLKKELVEGKETWKITQPEEVEADEAEVKKIVSAVATLKTDEFPSAEISIADAGMENAEQWVEISLKDGMTYTILIGNKEKTQYYVMKKDGSYLYLLNEFRVNSLFKTVEELKKKEPPPAPASAEMNPGETIPLSMGN